MGTSKKQTIGYKHYASMLLSLCLGRVDAIRALYYDDKVAWTGNETDNTSIYVNHNNLLGGDEEGGGIVGYFDLMFGDESQGAHSVLTSIFSLVPAFRRRLCVFANNVYLGTSPYIKVIAIEAERFTKAVDGGTIWHSSKAKISDYGMNPIHMIYECLTSRSFGSKLSAADFINDASFTAAADTLYTEGFGLSFLYDKERKQVDEFITMVLEHISAVLYINYQTGKHEIKLIRDDYDPELIPAFDQSDYIEARDFSRHNVGDLPNEVIVKYTDPATWEDAVVNCHNIASIEAKGAKISITKEFFGIHDATLANKVAGRELLAYNSALFSCTLEGKRTMYGLLPGDVFKISLPEYGIAEAIVRVIGIEYGGSTENSLIFNVVEDVFSNAQTIYSNPSSTEWISPTEAPADFTSVRLLEAPYYVLAQLFGDAVTELWTDDRGYLLTTVEQTNNALGYDIYENLTGSYLYQGQAIDITPSFELAENVDFGTSDVTVDVTNNTMPEIVSADSLAIIGNELVKIKSLSTTSVTFARGVVDTIPEYHSTGDSCYIISDFAGASNNEYGDADNFNVKLLPWTGAGKLDIADATAHNIVFDTRYLRPYVPSYFRFSGTGDLDFTWRNRNRLTQTAYLVEQDEGSVTPETNQTSTLTVLDDTTQVRQWTGLTGSSQAYTQHQQAEDFGLVISGTLSPDMTGSFDPNGTYNSKVKWDDGSTYAIWWNGSDRYYMTTIATIGTTPTDNAFERVSTNIIGTFSPIGTSTGTPTSTVGDMSTSVFKLKAVRDGYDSWSEWTIYGTDIGGVGGGTFGPLTLISSVAVSGIEASADITLGTLTLDSTAVTGSSGTQYYVSSTNANKSDSNAGTDPDYPWATVDKAISVWEASGFNAGDTIHLERGSSWNTTFSGGPMLSIGASDGGSSGNPITMRGDDYGTGAKPTITRTSGTGSDFVYIEGSYVTIRDITFDADTTYQASGCTISGTYQQVDGVTIKNCDFLNLGGGTTDYRCGIWVQAESTSTYSINDCVIEGNTISNPSAHGLNHYAACPMNNIVWRNNIVTNSNSTRYGARCAIQISTGSTNCIFEGNDLSDTTLGGWGQITLFCKNNDDGTGNIIRNNHMHDGPGYGLFLTTHDSGFVMDYEIYGNFIYGNDYCGMFLSPQNDNASGSVLDIYNNTFYDNNQNQTGSDYGEIRVHQNTTNLTVNIKDNILFQNKTGANCLSIRSGITGTVNTGNNLYWHSDGSSAVAIYDEGTTYTVTNATSFESTAQNSDPDMVSPSTENFNLNSGSPAIDNGIDLGLGDDIGALQYN